MRLTLLSLFSLFEIGIAENAKAMSACASSYALLRLVHTGSSDRRTWISQHLGEIGVVLLLCGGVLAPQWEISPAEPRLRRELFILAAIIAVYGWMLLIGKAKKVRLRAFYLIGLVFSICIVLSTAYGVGILHHRLSVRDFTEVPKAWMPTLYFAIGYAAQMSEAGLRRLLDFLAITTLLICLFGWAQFFDWRIAALLQPYYGDGGHNDLTLLLYHRVYSTLINPNVLSQFLSWTIIAYVLALVFGVGNRWRNVAVPVFCLINIVLSSSRYGILSVAFGFLFVLGLAVKTRRGISRVTGLALVFIVLSGIFVLASQRGSYIIARRFDELRNPTQAASLRARLDILWVDAFGYFLSSPIIGHGPAKTIFGQTFTDSEYMDILKWYGIVGFSVYALYYYWPLSQIRKGLRGAVNLPSQLEEDLKANLLIVRFGFVMLWMALFMNIGMFTCFNWQLMCYMWLWVGLAVRAAEVVRQAASLSGLPSSGANHAFAPRLSAATIPLPGAAANI